MVVIEIDKEILKCILKSHVMNLEDKLKRIDDLLQMDLKREYLNIKNELTKCKQLLKELEEGEYD